MKTLKIMALVVLSMLVSGVAFAGSTRIARSTGSGAVAVNLAPGIDFQLWEIRVHLDAAATQETFTVTSNISAGAEYDTKLYSTAMSSVQDIVISYNPALRFRRGDEIDLAWTNTDAATYGIEIVFTPSY